MPALEKNHIYRSTIEGYSSEGLGVARIDGQVVFVHDAVRGEDCDILVMKVLKNVAFGKPDATREEIIRACDEAYCDHFIRTLPQGYDTVIGSDTSSTRAVMILPLNLYSLESCFSVISIENSP